MKPILIFAVILLLCIGMASSRDIWQGLTKPYADTLYCALGSCGGTSGNYTNASYISMFYFNKTEIAYNFSNYPTFSYLWENYLNESYIWDNYYNKTSMPASGGSVNGTTINPKRIGINIDGFRALTIRYNETAIFGQAVDSPTFSTGISSNFLLQTEDLATTWQKYNVTIVINNVADPSNTTFTADSVYTNVSATGVNIWRGYGRINQTIANVKNETWTFSVQAKTQGQTNVTHIYLSIGYDLNNTDGNQSATYCPIDREWRECVTTANITAQHSTVNFNIFTVNDTNISITWLQADMSPLSRNYYVAQTTAATYSPITARTAIRGPLAVSSTFSATSGTFSSAVTATSLSGTSYIASSKSAHASSIVGFDQFGKVDGAPTVRGDAAFYISNASSTTVTVGAWYFAGAVGGRISEAASGWHPIIGTLGLMPQLIADTAAARTNYTATLYIQNATYINASKGNYSMWIDDGRPRIDSNLTLTSSNGSMWNCGVSNVGVFSCVPTNW